MESSHVKQNGVKFLVKTIKQSDLSSECWRVQLSGLIACSDCISINTTVCGGREIRKTNRNTKGRIIGPEGFEGFVG